MVEYLHNANKQRIAKKVDGEVIEKYLWLDLTTLLAVYDSNDQAIARFNYADDRMPVSMEKSGQLYYLHYDQVGTLKLVTDADGEVVKQIDYDSYGQVFADSRPTFSVPFGFAGGLYDTDTQLTRFGFRDYDAFSGRWTAKDPISFAGGDTNLYTYVIGDPINFVDSMGLMSFRDKVKRNMDDISSLETAIKGVAYGAYIHYKNKDISKHIMSNKYYIKFSIGNIKNVVKTPLKYMGTKVANPLAEAVILYQGIKVAAATSAAIGDELAESLIDFFIDSPDSQVGKRGLCK